MIIRTVLLLSATSFAASAAYGQVLQSPTQAEVCATVPAPPEQNLAIFNAIMIEPKKFKTLGDLFKALPPEAMAKLASTQAQEKERQAKDWPWLCRYAEANDAMIKSGARPKVVFIGDSITEGWPQGDASLFSQTVIGRGIGGQTTPQILLRFNQDVVSLRPRVVHIMAGTNDVSGNTGPITDTAIVSNLRAMIEIAKAHGISVVLAAITPTKQFVARPGVDPSLRIAAVNRELSRLAKEKRVTYVDYTPALADSTGALASDLGNDGLHPNRNGYAKMRPLTDKAIRQAMGAK